MKKILSILIALIIISTCTLTVFAGETVTMYSLDGRSITIYNNQISTYEKLGWYEYPVTTIYNLSNETAVISKSELDTYLSIGWYTEPVVKIFANDGRTAVVAKSQLDAYVKAGWFEEKKVTIYSPQGNEIQIWKSQLNSYLNEGWYTYPVVYVYDKYGTPCLINKTELQTYINNGWFNAAYDDNGVKILFLGASYKENGNFVVKLHIYNNSDKLLCIDASDGSINSIPVAANMSKMLESGKNTNAEVVFYNTDLDKNNILTTDEFKFRFNIYNWDLGFQVVTPSVNYIRK